MTFGAGGDLELSYEIEQTSSMAQTAEYTSSGDWEGPTVAHAGNHGISQESVVGPMYGELDARDTDSEAVEVHIGRNADRASVRTQTVDVFLLDENAGDVFTVKIEEDPVYGTPIFTTMGGESSCPGETSTTRREAFATFKSIIPHCGRTALGPAEGPCRDLAPGEPAYFGVIIENRLPLEELTAQAPEEFVVKFENELVPWDASNKYDGQCGTDGYAFGLEMSTLENVGRLVGDGGVAGGFGPLRLPFGQFEFLIKVERFHDATCVEFNNAQLTLTMTCTTYNDYQYQEKMDGNELRVVYPEWDHVNKKFTDETSYRGPRRRPKSIEWRSDASPRAS